MTLPIRRVAYWRPGELMAIKQDSEASRKILVQALEEFHKEGRKMWVEPHPTNGVILRGVTWNELEGRVKEIESGAARTIERALDALGGE